MYLVFEMWDSFVKGKQFLDNAISSSEDYCHEMVYLSLDSYKFCLKNLTASGSYDPMMECHVNAAIGDIYYRILKLSPIARVYYHDMTKIQL